MNAGPLAMSPGTPMLPTVGSPTCHVCRSPHRFEVESALVAGQPTRLVVLGLPDGHGLTARNCRDHVRNGHLSVTPEQVRERLAERSAHEASVVEVAVDHLAFSQRVMTAVDTAITLGVLQPTVRDGVAAASVMARWEATTGGGGIPAEQVESAMGAWMDAARAVMTREEMTRFGRLLDNDPRLAALDRLGEIGA